MKARPRFWTHMGITALAVSAFGLLLAGCGGDEPTATPSPTPPPPGATSTPTPDAAAAFQAEWDALSAAAQQEGQLIAALGGSGRPLREMYKVFADKFGIEVVVSRGSGREQASRVLAEQSAGRFEVDTFTGGLSTAIQTIGIWSMLNEKIPISRTVSGIEPRARSNRSRTSALAKSMFVLTSKATQNPTVFSLEKL